MITIRQAEEADLPAIEAMLAELELGHTSIALRRFHVAAEGGEIVGIVNVEDCGASLYVSAVGVAERYRGRGIARLMLEDILRGAAKDVYVYTRIPDFFRRFGFVAADAPADIPRREIYGCEACYGNSQCVCMVRRWHDSRIS